MKTIEAGLGFSSSEVAQFRLRCIKMLEQYGYEGARSAFPQVSRRSEFRWEKSFSDSGKKLLSLKSKSTRPKHIKHMVVPAVILGVPKQWRKQYPHLSKYKLKVFLDAWCEENGLEKRSVSWIGKVLTRYQLFFCSRKPVKWRRSRPRSRYHIYRCPNVSKLIDDYLSWMESRPV